MAEPATKKKEKISSLYPDWSQLPAELLHLISKKLKENNCFDVIHARSVCTSWRSAFPFPSCLLRPSYSLPMFPSESRELCTLEKVPLFLFRVRADAAKYLLGGISRDGSDDHTNLLLPSPLQCSVKANIPGCDPTLMNMLDCQIIPLGHQYRMIGREHNRSAFLPLDKEGGGAEFVVVSSTFLHDFMVLTSVEMRWKHVENIPSGRCTNIVTFRGRFYATFMSSNVVTIDPYSLEVTLLLSSPQNLASYLVPCGDDELFLVESIRPALGLIEISVSRFTFRVSKLDDKTGTWVEVKDLGDRVLFIGQPGNVSCSAKELPHGCDLSGNSILFTFMPGNVKLALKYGVQTGNTEDNLNCWRPLTKNREVILNKFRSVMTLRVER